MRITARKHENRAGDIRSQVCQESYVLSSLIWRYVEHLYVYDTLATHLSRLPVVRGGWLVIVFVVRYSLHITHSYT